MSLDLVNNDNFLVTKPKKLATLICNNCNGQNLKLSNKHESQLYRIKAAENEKKSRFLHISLPFLTVQREDRGGEHCRTN